MRLGKRVKINMILAILLCMVFVVNIGYTLALSSASYQFKAKVWADESNNEIYTEYAKASTTSGIYEYSVGSKNRQLSINYGFSCKYDLKIKFTAIYSNDGALMGENDTHIANDFTLNFVDRDNWCIDMLGIGEGFAALSKIGNTETAIPAYLQTSNTSTLTGVMYYMKKIEGSGTLPIISGVTFYTSPNGSVNYIGDKLTVTLEPEYVKSDDSKYNSNHAFATSSKLLYANNSTAFNIWASYMNNTTLAAPQYMVYNSYFAGKDLRDNVLEDNYIDTSLSYPSDFDWTIKDGEGNYNFNIVGKSEPIYQNTAYRYSVDKVLKQGSTTEYTLKRGYAAVAAGNSYNGGLGLYVIPTANMTTVGFTIKYYWQKDYTVDDYIPINMIDLNYSNDISIVTTKVDGVDYQSLYYKEEISSPTYINIIDNLMLKAEGPFATILNNGYKLVITDLTVIFEESAPSGWISQTKLDYEVNNSTSQSPILVPISKVINGDYTTEANVSINNNGTTPIAVTEFTVKGKLWYPDYSSNGSVFEEEIVGYLPNECLQFNSDIWNKSYNPDTNTYKFTRKNSSVHLLGGTSLQIVSGVTIPKQYYPKDADFEVLSASEGTYKTKYVNDLWCSLEVEITGTAEVTYNEGNTSGLEVITDGYYLEISAGSTASIYVRNNTSQNINAIELSALNVYYLTSGTTLPRERMDSTANISYSVKYFNETASVTYYANPGEGQTSFNSTPYAITIRPNETILFCTITPSANAIISNYKVTAWLDAGVEDADVDMVFDHTNNLAEIINNSDSYYEFRIKADKDMTDYLINPNDFIEDKIADNLYYYYYKGVICKHQAISVIKNLSASRGVSVDYIEHINGVTASQYIYDNYKTWDPPTEWFDVMKLIYGEPTLN